MAAISLETRWLRLGISTATGSAIWRWGHPAMTMAANLVMSLEVPWRDGTAIRSARREDLVRLLVPLQRLPSIELLDGSATVDRHDGINPGYGGQPSEIERSEHLRWGIRLTLYLTPHTSELLTLPFHRATMTFQIGSTEPPIDANVTLNPPYQYTSGPKGKLDSHTIRATSAEAIIEGPGRMYAECEYKEPLRCLPAGHGLAARLTLRPADQDASVEMLAEMREVVENGDFKREWQLSK